MTDRRIFQTVVIILGAALLLGVAGIVLLAVLDKPTPGVLENLSVAALASLGAMLARTPRDEPMAVEGVPGGEPVAVDPKDAGHIDLPTALTWVCIGTIAYVLGGICLRYF